MAARAADEDVEQVIERRGCRGGIDVGGSRGGDRGERRGLGRGVLARKARLKLEPGRDEPVAGGPCRALPHQPHDLPREGGSGMPVGRGPGEFAHHPIEILPVKIPLEFQRELVGHHQGQDLARSDPITTGRGLREKPGVELPRRERLPQVEAVADEERVGVVVALQTAHKDFVEPGGHEAAGLIGGRQGDESLIERCGSLQVTGGEGRVAGRHEQPRGRRGMAGEPCFHGQMGRVGVAAGAGLGERLDRLWFSRIGRESGRLSRRGRGRREADQPDDERQREAGSGGCHGSDLKGWADANGRNAEQECGAVGGRGCSRISCWPTGTRCRQ